MAVEVLPCADPREFGAALFSIGQYFGFDPSAEDVARVMRILPLERMLAAHDGDAIVGGAGAFPFELAVPGGTLPCGGITVVGVYPTHRRRGVLTAMMRRQLDDLHAAGEPVAALWASEEPIYGRFGYGRATLVGSFELAQDRSGYALPFEPEGTIRLVDTAEVPELCTPVWDAVWRRTPGMFRRPAAWWSDRVVRDPPERRDGAGPKRFVVYEAGGEVEGYAIYRHQVDFADGLPAGALVVVESMGRTPRATRELWRFLLDVDWAVTIRAALLPPDHPLLHLLAEPRRLRLRLGDGIWLRLVEVGAALSGRAYAADDPLVLEVEDAFCPWNEGRWKLEGGEAARTADEPDLRLSVADLSAVYLGGFTFRELEQAFRVEEVRAGALERADAIFRRDLHPWCPEVF
jgi:predicted acetyltransferase